MRVNRGNNGASNLNANNSWNTNSNNGFRPVLGVFCDAPDHGPGHTTCTIQERPILSAERCKHMNNGTLPSTEGKTTVSNIFNQITSKQNFQRAYSKCLQGKCRYKRQAIEFEQDQTFNLDRLRQGVISGDYRASGYTKFYVYEPKKRLIYAAGFADKVVQMAAYLVIKEVYKRSFIYDSYACIDNRGTHAASERIFSFLRRAKWQYGDQAYIAKIDISKYFYSIDRQILKSILPKKIRCRETLGLLNRIIDSGPGDKGLPLGNITSHIFANIYLNELDQYCKRRLGIKYYVRYMDDACMILPDKQAAQQALDDCVELITGRLKLEKNPDKTMIFPANQGVNFVGFKTLPTHRLLRDRSKKAIRRKTKKMPGLITDGRMSTQKAEQILNSWNGHAKHASSWNFIKSLLQIHGFLSYSNKFTINYNIT